jgi:hypothetical protein
MLRGPHSSPRYGSLTFWWLNIKEAKNKTKIECLFQEPVFTPSDKEFIESLGHHVVESPRGFDKIDHSSLLFGVHLYRPIYAKALEHSLPAIFVGTDLDVWDWYVPLPLRNIMTISRGADTGKG